MMNEECILHSGFDRRRGFSTYEVVLVLVIVSIVSAIAIPHYASAVTNQRVEAAIRRVTLDIALARSRARTDSAECKLAFDAAGDQYTIVGLPDSDRPASDYTVELAHEPYVAHLGSANFDGDTELVFNGFGVPKAGGSITLTIGSVMKVLTVDGQTGETSVADFVEVLGQGLD